MSEIYMDEQSEAVTPSAGEVVIYPKTDGKIYAKDDSGIEQTLTNLQGDINNSYRTKYVNLDYTVDILSDSVIITYQTTDITITFPELNTFLNNDQSSEYVIINLGNSGSVTVKTSGSDVFSNGLSSMKLLNSETFRIIGTNPLLGQGWIRSNNLHRRIQLRLSTPWSDNNFSSWASIPWDTEDYSDDNSVLIWDNTIPNKITVKNSGVFSLSIFGTFNSTGGSGSYNGYVQLLKNGADIIAGSEQYTRDYRREDSPIAISGLVTKLTTDDYIEVQLKHKSLTGEAVNFVCILSTIV